MNTTYHETRPEEALTQALAAVLVTLLSYLRPLIENK